MKYPYESVVSFSKSNKIRLPEEHFVAWSNIYLTSCVSNLYCCLFWMMPFCPILLILDLWLKTLMGENSTSIFFVSSGELLQYQEVWCKNLSPLPQFLRTFVFCLLAFLDETWSYRNNRFTNIKLQSWRGLKLYNLKCNIDCSCGFATMQIKELEVTIRIRRLLIRRVFPKFIIRYDFQQKNSTKYVLGIVIIDYIICNTMILQECLWLNYIFISMCILCNA